MGNNLRKKIAKELSEEHVSISDIFIKVEIELHSLVSRIASRLSHSLDLIWLALFELGGGTQSDSRKNMGRELGKQNRNKPVVLSKIPARLFLVVLSLFSVSLAVLLILIAEKLKDFLILVLLSIDISYASIQLIIILFASIQYGLGIGGVYYFVSIINEIRVKSLKRLKKNTSENQEFISDLVKSNKTYKSLR